MKYAGYCTACMIGDAPIESEPFEDASDGELPAMVSPLIACRVSTRRFKLLKGTKGWSV
ncbi:UNVERIFIED_ORG: hypothetical protein QOE_1988 [Clostridioides difficile F501]